MAQYGHSYAEIYRAVRVVYPYVKYSTIRALTMKIKLRMAESMPANKPRKGVFGMEDMKNITEQVSICSFLWHLVDLP